MNHVLPIARDGKDVARVVIRHDGSMRCMDESLVQVRKPNKTMTMIMDKEGMERVDRKRGSRRFSRWPFLSDVH